MKQLPPTFEKILVRSTNWIGDAVMTTPALRTIRQNFPASEITVLAHPWVGDVFRYNPCVDHVMTYEKKGRHKGILGMLALVQELRQKRFDCALLLQNAFEAALLSKLAGIPVRAGYSTDDRGLLLTHPVSRKFSGPKGHEVLYYQRIMAGLGMELAPNRLELHVPEEQKLAIRDKVVSLQGEDFFSQMLVGFSPGAAFGPAKRWPAEKYAALARKLCERNNARILLFGSEADRETGASIINQAGEAGQHILNLAGQTNLIEAIALINQCNVFVTNDSGLMHVAAALHTPLVAIFGSTDHIATGPFSENATVVRREMECSPCKKTHCPYEHFRCMQTIESDEVYEAVVKRVE